MEILVTSENLDKLEVVKTAFIDNVTVVGVKANSLLPEQPFWTYGEQSSAIICAKLRIKNILSIDNKINEKYKYVVSLENGIYNDAIDNYWDICECVIYDCDNDEYVTTQFNNSLKIPVPHDIMEKVMNTEKVYFDTQLIGYSKTAGSLLEQEYKIPGSNWMKKFGLDRKDQMYQSLKYVLSLLKHNMNKIEQNIKIIKNYPQEGVDFKDMFSIFMNDKLLNPIIDKMCDIAYNNNAQYIAGPELRGCILGSLVANKMNIPFIPIRKKGKLPPPVYTISYEKEYGVDELEISENYKDEIKGKNVVIIDDVLATGGSLKACIDLARAIGLTVSSCIVLTCVKELYEKALEKLDIKPLIIFN